jgi:hypothetical protein
MLEVPAVVALVESTAFAGSELVTVTSTPPEGGATVVDGAGALR